MTTTIPFLTAFGSWSTGISDSGSILCGTGSSWDTAGGIRAGRTSNRFVKASKVMRRLIGLWSLVPIRLRLSKYRFRSSSFKKCVALLRIFCQGALTRHQAVHPFYVFQIASLILWSLDSYYYYATCIFIISVFSIATTIVETRTVS